MNRFVTIKILLVTLLRAKPDCGHPYDRERSPSRQGALTELETELASQESISLSALFADEDRALDQVPLKDGALGVEERSPLHPGWGLGGLLPPIVSYPS